MTSPGPAVPRRRGLMVAVAGVEAVAVANIVVAITAGRGHDLLLGAVSAVVAAGLVLGVWALALSATRPRDLSRRGLRPAPPVLPTGQPTKASGIADTPGLMASCTSAPSSTRGRCTISPIPTLIPYEPVRRCPSPRPMFRCLFSDLRACRVPQRLHEPFAQVFDAGVDRHLPSSRLRKARSEFVVVE